MILLFDWLLAFSPIALVLVLMLQFQWGGARAGAAGWIMAVVVAWAAFGAGPEVLLHAQTKGALLTLYVLYIVWAALLLFFVVEETGAVRVIGVLIRRLTTDRPLQLLIIGWVFGTFLQGIAGFGVPIAVAAPILLGLGFSPLVSVAAPAIGHSWAVTFGNMATSFEALQAVTGVDGAILTHWSGILLGISGLLSGVGVVAIHGGWRAVRASALPIIIIGTAMGVVQYLMANAGAWTLGGLAAGIVGILISIPVARFTKPKDVDETPVPTQNGDGSDKDIGLAWALAAYFLFFVVVGVAGFVPPVKEMLNQVRVSLDFPAVETALGWVVPAGPGKSISIFGHPGAHLLYAAVLAYLMYMAKGFYRPGALSRILTRTAKSGIPTSLGMLPVVSFAVVMDQTGMTYRLAEGISATFGAGYPAFAAAVGGLGAFMTGSTTNSNVVFGAFQMHTAELTGLGVPLILAAQTTGASIGSMLAPAKILVGCSTVGLAGREGPVLAVTIKTGAIILAIMGIITLAIVWLAQT